MSSKDLKRSSESSRDKLSKKKESSKQKPDVEKSACPVCGLHIRNLQYHLIIEHLPFLLFPFTACWVCGKQLGSSHALKLHIQASHPRQEGQDATFKWEKNPTVWANLVTGFLYAFASLFSLVSLESLRAFALSLGLLPCPPEQDKDTQNFFRVAIQQQPPSGLSPQQISELLSSNLLGSLTARLPEANQAKVKNMFALPCSCRGLPNAHMSSQYGVVAHFHLDEFLVHTKKKSFQEALVFSAYDMPYDLKYAVSSYCYPDQMDEFVNAGFAQEDGHVFRAIGFHPSRIESHGDVPFMLSRIRSLLLNPRAVALGEVGLDYHPSISEPSRAGQRKMLVDMLLLAVELHKPVIVCCEGYGSPDAERDCRTILQEVLHPFHPIFRLNFSGSVVELMQWRQAFPNTVFGFNSKITPEQYSSLSPVLPLTHTVLEADSDSNSISISAVAEIIAFVRQCPSEEVLTLTASTAIRFFSLEDPCVYF